MEVLQCQQGLIRRNPEIRSCTCRICPICTWDCQVTHRSPPKPAANFSYCSTSILNCLRKGCVWKSWGQRRVFKNGNTKRAQSTASTKASGQPCTMQQVAGSAPRTCPQSDGVHALALHTQYNTDAQHTVVLHSVSHRSGDCDKVGAPIVVGKASHCLFAILPYCHGQQLCVPMTTQTRLPEMLNTDV